jgi:methoxymalonate biosynthesis acyl carrier protein
VSDQSAVIEDIREFLGQFVSDPSVPVDQDLFGSGLVNSLFAMQLVLHIEAEYGIAVSNDDLDLDNFRSLQAIAGFVGRKRGD